MEIEKVQPWEIRDYGASPVSIAARGDGPSIAKVYVTEYRKRGRAPALLRSMRAIAHVPVMLDALRTVAMGNTNPDDLARIAAGILAEIDGEAV